jgi:hypothetical protein
VVVAIPAPLLVERDEQDVRLLQPFKGGLAVGAPGERVT